MKNCNVFIVISILLFSFVQTDEKDRKYWNTSPQLTWDDFKGVADKNSAYAAMSDCQFTSKMKGKKDSITFFVQSYFNPFNSWVKDDQKNETLLKHEQGHFNIDEIFARKFRKDLKESKVYKATVPYFFKDMQKKYVMQLIQEQELYDKETEHKNNREKQLEWDKKIEKELKALEAYSGTEVKVAYSLK